MKRAALWGLSLVILLPSSPAPSGMVTGRRIHHPATAVGPGLSCPAPKVAVTDLATGKPSCAMPGMAVKGAGVPEHTTIQVHKTADATSPM